jgi:hypothetical protein
MLLSVDTIADVPICQSGSMCTITSATKTVVSVHPTLLHEFQSLKVTQHAAVVAHAAIASSSVSDERSASQVQHSSMSILMLQLAFPLRSLLQHEFHLLMLEGDSA